MADETQPMGLDPMELRELLAVLKDAGVLEFTCAAFTARFPAPVSAVVQVLPERVPPAERGVKRMEGHVDEGPANPYARLFGGKLPTLGTPE